MNPLLALTRNRKSTSQQPCAFCAGRTDRQLAPEPGIEPTVFERDPAHGPECPLLHPKWPLMVAATVALIPTLSMGGCLDSSHYTAPPTGLDTGSVGAADIPLVQIEKA